MYHTHHLCIIILSMSRKFISSAGSSYSHPDLSPIADPAPADISGPHPLGNHMDNTWAQIGTTWHHLETAWTTLGHHSETPWSQFGDNSGTTFGANLWQPCDNFMTTFQSLWDNFGKGSRQLLDSFETTLRLWINIGTSLRQREENFETTLEPYGGRVMTFGGA